ncbi:SUV39H2 [Cordylochernes scorpioides]|uniref:Histone-lysine N-methyltransferase n=1 Tax=Cordylochernes scorpioides TaxID=51811 RepID=A0ABY6KPZ4_9ARAC|nr:SUV39H2 [Cordylochernes scorpioides]
MFALQTSAMTKDHLTSYCHKTNGLWPGETKLDDHGQNIPPSPATASLDDAPSSPQAALTPHSTNPAPKTYVKKYHSASSCHKRSQAQSENSLKKRKYYHLWSKYRLEATCLPLLESIDDLMKSCERENLKFCNVFNMEALDGGVYEVEEIILMSVRSGMEPKYFVKWTNWPSEFNSWETRSELGNCKALLSLFMRRPYARCQLKHPNDQPLFVKTLVGMTSPEFLDPLPLFKILGTPIDVNKSRPYKLKSFKEKLSDILALGGSLEKRLQVSSKFGSVEKFILFVNKRQEALKEIEEWKETRLRDFNMEVENLVDLEVPPLDFEFIMDYRAGEGITIPNDPFVGCECEDCFSSKTKCCPSKSGANFPFLKSGALHIVPGFPIYECNKLCRCGPDCENRITQKGTKVRLSIFRTSNGKGWGVKTLDKIRKDMFVMEYMGEIISNEEAERRGQIYNELGSTYLFDLDFETETNAFTVDATYMGNASHFVNHSCSPNMTVFAVWVNNLDSRMPRIAFFSNRTIQPGEELTFDYTKDMQQKQTKQPNDEGPQEDLDYSSFTKMDCKCGAPSCRKTIFT